MTDHREDAPEAYADLLAQYERVTALGGVQGTLSWDQQVMMPEGGNPARSTQLSVASGLSHDLLTDDVVGDALDDLETADLTDDQAAVVREIERQYVRADRVPRDLVEEISQTSSEALQAWEEARENDDFETFAPYLADLVDLKREYAAHIDDERDPYAVLFEEYEPYIDLDTAERVLERLREELVPLIGAVEASDADLAAPFADGTYDPDAQEAVSRDVLDVLGYDWDRGRLDTSTHPFTVGNQFDSRITTRFSEDEPLDSMMSTVHEFGHARYNLGLPQDEYGTPLGEARDLTVHESQSRLWENHVGRSAAFWERFTPTLREHFSSVDATPRDLYEAANRVYPDNLIRVEADELTYHMHIVLRFEIERDLISGDLDVADVPETWNDKMDDYLGVRPETDSEGCLQDIHWSHGNFGYFPTYSLGSVLAAQLYAHAEDDIDDLDAAIAEGDFDPLADWLGEHVHRHGCRYTTPELIEAATGEPYTADYFIDYAESKFGQLYDL